MANAFSDKLLDIIYPARCPFCNEIVVPKGNRVCPACLTKLPYINEPRCVKCSKPVENEEAEYCSDCSRKGYHYERGFALWLYDDMMRHSIADFKYHSRKDNAVFYTDEIIRLYGQTIKAISPDVIVPVPIHRSKYLERGYNQAQILAALLGRNLNIPVLSELLLRSRKTMPQKKLSDKERLKNLSEAFCFHTETSLDYNKPIYRVLLVDDIYTTGSTIEACTNILKANGVAEVYFVVLCIGKGF